MVYCCTSTDLESKREGNNVVRCSNHPYNLLASFMAASSELLLTPLGPLFLPRRHSSTAATNACTHDNIQPSQLSALETSLVCTPFPLWLIYYLMLLLLIQFTISQPAAGITRIKFFISLILQCRLTSKCHPP